MSDTQAMTPKEPPRTCGHADPYALSCDICCKSRRIQVGYDEKDCGYWVEDADTLEQRCQQLEQVAREMLEFIEGIEREYPHMLDPNRKPGGQIVYPMSSEYFRNQLEELGGELV